MRSWLLGAPLAAAVLACGGGTTPTTNAGVTATVTGRFQDWVKAFNWASPDSLAPFYEQTDYFTAARPNGERTRGWAKESEFQKDFLPTVRVMNLSPQSPVVTLVRKDLALVTFGLSLDMDAGGTRTIGSGQGTTLWQDDGGAWKLYAVQLAYTNASQSRTGPAAGKAR